MRVALASLGLATAVRMVDRVHRRTAHRRAHATPAARAGLAELLQVVLGVADLADRRAAFRRNLAHLAGAQAQRGITLLASDQLRRGTCRTRDLRTLARLHLDAMHRRADRDVAQRKRVADLDRRITTGHQLIADLRTLRRDDVATFTVHETQQRDVRSAVGIVLDALDAAGDAFLVALEVDDPVMLLRAAALVARRDATVVVAATGLRLLLGQRRVRRALVQARRDHAHDCTAAGGSWFDSNQCHASLPQAFAVT